MEGLLISIYEFWEQNPNYWINSKQKTDDLIKEKFFGYYELLQDIKSINISSKEHLLALIIYFDQFSRHFQRNNLISEEDVSDNRNKALDLFTEYYSNYSYEQLAEFDMIFMLMVLKHIDLDRFGKFILLEVNNYTNYYKLPISKMKILNKFFEDTYQKVYTKDELELIKYPFQEVDNKFNMFEDVCDNFDNLVVPSEVGFHHIKNSKIYNNIKNYLNTKNVNDLIISLSGGVDSNLIAYLTSLMNNFENYYKKVNVKLFHIVYGNRAESLQELEFIKKYASNLRLDLYVYHVPLLKRNYNSRKFYEEMTRKLRFNCYKKVETNPVVALGHINDDIIENIITNFCNKKELFDLKKMHKMMYQDDVTIYRPFLNIRKKDIYKYANIFQISYLKNTTPTWSNRGKFRNEFYPSLINQYGKQIDDTLMYNAEIYQSYDNIVKKILLKPFFGSIKYDSENTKLIADYKMLKEHKLPIHLWNDIFEHMFYNYFKKNKPSNSSITHFVDKINNTNGRFKCHLTKNLCACIKNDELLILS